MIIFIYFIHILQINIFIKKYLKNEKEIKFQNSNVFEKLIFSISLYREIFLNARKTSDTYLLRAI